jgi:type IV fimbrial biogenesis protein FimT
MKSTNYGLTLIELLISLVITAVISSCAYASLHNFMQKTYSAETKSELYSSFSLAMAEATIRNYKTVMCPSIDGKTCSTGIVWQHGWLVFVDLNADREISGNEPIVVSQSALAESMRLSSTIGRNRLVFQSGGSNAGSNVSFTLCDGRGTAFAQAIILSNTGRIRSTSADPIIANSLCFSE